MIINKDFVKTINKPMYRKPLALTGLLLIWVLSYFGLFFVNVQQATYAIFVVFPFISLIGQSSRIEKVLVLASILIIGILSYLNCFSLNITSYLCYLLTSIIVFGIYAIIKSVYKKSKIK